MEDRVVLVKWAVSLSPGRILFSISGVPALTSRNFKEEDFVTVVKYIDRGINIAMEAKNITGVL